MEGYQGVMYTSGLYVPGFNMETEVDLSYYEKEMESLDGFMDELVLCVEKGVNVDRSSFSNLYL